MDTFKKTADRIGPTQTGRPSAIKLLLNNLWTRCIGCLWEQSEVAGLQL